jgi:hypothetical protein
MKKLYFNEQYPRYLVSNFLELTFYARLKAVQKKLAHLSVKTYSYNTAIQNKCHLDFSPL